MDAKFKLFTPLLACMKFHIASAPKLDGWIILGWISRRWDVGIWTGLGWPRIETGGGRL